MPQFKGLPQYADSCGQTAAPEQEDLKAFIFRALRAIFVFGIWYHKERWLNEILEIIMSGNLFERKKSGDILLIVGQVQRWDIREGNLYFLKTLLLIDGQEADDLIDRVGFRTVRISGEDILLNGKKVRIKGFSRHEDYGQFGCSLPPEAMMDDLQLILDMGGNSIRTCHYPNDPLGSYSLHGGGFF